MTVQHEQLAPSSVYPVTVADDALDVALPIEGLRFEKNLVTDVDVSDGWFSQKLLSSEGPLVSDFVTHEVGFEYNTYGIHVGQIDRLTFMGGGDQPIVGHFIDCREGSPTLHHVVSVRYRASLLRRLIVPRGVAHTFDNLSGVVTRDEPVWYADFDNIDWDVNNDLVSIPRTTPPESYPIIRINHLRMPDEVHRFVSRVSQDLLETPIAYASRHLLRIGTEDVYVSFQSKRWGDDEAEIAKLLDAPDIPGVGVRRSRYALTGPNSWTLVPNTSACVSDVLVLPPSSDGRQTHRFLHRRTRKWYTILTKPGSKIRWDFVDYRCGSATYGQAYSFDTVADPRVSVVMEPGVAYALSCSEELLVRSEHEVFVARDEPRSDLPPFGGDLVVLPHAETPSSNPPLPDTRLPDEILCSMATSEQEVVRETMRR